MSNQRQPQIGLDEEMMAAAAEAKAGPFEEARKLRNAMGRLSADHRRVIVLHNWEQLAFPEVGKRMNRSTEAVKKLWSRALQNLRTELSREEQSN